MQRSFVLVPGAWLGAWCWSAVTPRLEAKGRVAVPVTLTGMGDRVHLASKDVGMETAIQDVVNTIRYRELDEVVLVGHSFAGKVAAAVADRIPERVRQVIYLDAFRPERVREPQGGFDPRKEFPSITPDGLAVALTGATIETIGKDVVGPVRARLEALATPWPIRLASDPIVLSSRYDRTKEAYIFCTLAGDPVEEIVAGKWGKLEGPHRLLETGHWPMLTRPEALADALLELAD
jgi:pimeloyl-ACP methyl ester carboxylesterase